MSMRITQNTLFEMLRNQMQSNSANLLSAQQRVATQKKFDYLSENPVDGGRVLDMNTALVRSQQYVKNIDRASSLAGIQDTTLGQVNDLIGRAKELLLQESNEVTSTSSTRQAARIEIAHLTSQLVQTANTQFDGQSVGGFNTQSPAFTDAAVTATATAVTGGAGVSGQQVLDATQLTYHNYQLQFTSPTQYSITDLTTGAPVLVNQPYTSGAAIQFDGLQLTLANQAGAPAAGDTFAINTTAPGVYRGDGNLQEVEIQAGTRVAQNIPGNRVFQGVGVPDGVDLFAIMNGINQALASNDRTALQTQLGNLDQAQTQIANERSAVGSRVNLLDSANQRQSDLQTNLQTMRSGVEDIDLADAIVELNKQQNTYQATLGAAAKIVQPSLLDFLR